MTGSLALQTCLVGAVLLGGIFYPISLPRVPEITFRPPVPRHVRLVAARGDNTVQSVERNPALQRFAEQRFFHHYPLVATRLPPAQMPDFTGMPELDSGVSLSSAREQGSMLSARIRSIPPPPPPSPAKSAAEATAPSRITMGGNVLAAQIIHRPAPIYPPLARQMRVEGVVQLHGVISREGRIIDLRVVSGHPLLAGAALAAVREWRYQPTFLNGQPVEVEAPIEVRFVLER